MRVVPGMILILIIAIGVVAIIGFGGGFDSGRPPATPITYESTPEPTPTPKATPGSTPTPTPTAALPTPTPTSTPGTPTPLPTAYMTCADARDVIQAAINEYYSDRGVWPTFNDQPGDIAWGKLVPQYMSAVPSNDANCEWRVNSNPVGQVCLIHVC